MADVTVLQAARDLISDHHHWTKGSLARDNSGRETFYDAPDACRWCAVGALAKALRQCGAPDRGFRLVGGNERALLNRVAFELFDEESIMDANDNRNHADVLTIFDEAIRRASLEAPIT